MFTKTLLPDTLRAIKLVAQIEELKNAYLAGGTALALQIGHRISVDLDFFTQMKVHTIERRGTRRDFIDVYFLAKKYTLEHMLDFYQEKYTTDKDHLYAVLRSLDYFEDAEQESEMPKMLIEVDWERVKEYFRNGTRVLVEKNLQA